MRGDGSEVEGDGSTVPVWPSGFGAEASGGEVRVLNRRGKVVARVGDEVDDKARFYTGVGVRGRSQFGPCREGSRPPVYRQDSLQIR